MKASLCLALSFAVALSASALDVQVTRCADNVGIQANVSINTGNALATRPTDPAGNIKLDVSAGDVISAYSAIFTGLDGVNHKVTQADIQSGKLTLCLQGQRTGGQHTASTFTWKVNNRPLPIGVWETSNWTEAQTARASNNQNFNLHTGPATIKWIVTSTVDDPKAISFNVVIDRPGSDITAWKNQTNNSTVVAPTDIELTMKVSVQFANERGFYIATPRGATAPFYVTAIIQQ